MTLYQAHPVVIAPLSKVGIGCILTVGDVDVTVHRFRGPFLLEGIRKPQLNATYVMLETTVMVPWDVQTTLPMTRSTRSRPGAFCSLREVLHAELRICEDRGQLKLHSSDFVVLCNMEHANSSLQLL